MEKENKKREQEHIKEMQLTLQRKARVKEEVSYADPRVMVTVSHF